MWDGWVGGALNGHGTGNDWVGRVSCSGLCAPHQFRLPRASSTASEHLQGWDSVPLPPPPVPIALSHILPRPNGRADPARFLVRMAERNHSSHPRGWSCSIPAGRAGAAGCQGCQLNSPRAATSAAVLHCSIQAAHTGGTEVAACRRGRGAGNGATPELNGRRLLRRLSAPNTLPNTLLAQLPCSTASPAPFCTHSLAQTCMHSAVRGSDRCRSCLGSSWLCCSDSRVLGSSVHGDGFLESSVRSRT